MDDPEIECMLIRAQEMARYVEQGVLDVGLTGMDWVRENRPRSGRNRRPCLREAESEAKFAGSWRCPRIPNSRTAEDLEGCVIATELVNVTKKFFAEKNVNVRVDFSWGATEVKPPVLADAIVEVTETGSSLRANRLRIIDTVMESFTQVIANQQAMKEEWKREKISNLALMLTGAIAAQGRVGLMLNVRKEDLQGVLNVLPALKRPTISELAEDNGELWVAVNTIIEETTARDIIPKLKAAKAQGIVEYPLNKIVV